MANFSYKYSISVTREMRPGYYVKVQFDRKKRESSIKNNKRMEEKT